MLVGKDVYYKNVVLFVQRLQNLVTFNGAALVKANIATSLQGSAFEWYTSELSDFDCDAFNNDPGVKSWINTFFYRFKVLTNIAFGLVTNETYSHDDVCARQSPAQYVYAIMRHGIGCNIVDIANQLSFAYRGLAPELRVFISPTTESTKTADFICTFEEKQEIWHEMMTASSALQWYYSPAQRLSPYRLFLPNQSESFTCFQSQQRVPQPQLPWRGFERGLDATPPSLAINPHWQYTPQPFCQLFALQRQHYPSDLQQQSRVLSSANAVTRNASDTQSTPYGTRNAADSTNYNPPRYSGNFCQAVPYQPYQLGPPQCAYQRAKEKGIYEIDNDPAPEIDEEDLDAENSYFANKGYDKLQVNFVAIESMYDHCSASFQSRSALHRHIKSGWNALKKIVVAETGSDLPFPRPILCSAAKLSAPGSGLAFRDWSYTTTLITFDPALLPAVSNPDTSVCLDTGCGVSLVDKTWLAKKHPFQKISTMPVPLKVKGIGTSRYESNKFAFTTLYILGLDQEGSEVYAYIKCKLYLVEDLKANMLIGNNIFCTEGFTINLASAFAHILSCEVTIVINARNHLQFLRGNVLTDATTFTSPKSEALINFQ